MTVFAPPPPDRPIAATANVMPGRRRGGLPVAAVVPRRWRAALLLGVAQVARRMADSGWPWDARPARVPVAELKVQDGMVRMGRAHGAGDFEVNPWLVPVINNEIRLQKPPFPYWCSAVLFKWFGFSEW